VLAGACLGDDAWLAELFGEQGLAEGVVDLMGTGVAEVFAFEIDAAFSVGDVLAEFRGEEEWGGATDVFAEEFVEVLAEARVLADFVVCFFQFEQDGHEGLGDIASAELAEVAARVWSDGFGVCLRVSHA